MAYLRFFDLSGFFQRRPRTQCDRESVSGPQEKRFSYVVSIAIAAVSIALTACGGGAGSSGTSGNTARQPLTSEEASSFLMSASFGPTQESIDALKSSGYSTWFKDQVGMPINSIAAISDAELRDGNVQEDIVREAWFDNAVLGQDQLRQRAAFALSQIFVTSTTNNSSRGQLHSTYLDILQEGAFGNFRDLLDEVTYSPAMGEYLTYVGNKKADPEKGSAPDENYAREIMQLLTIGLVELNSDGTAKLGSDGEPIETYTNEDITGLAKVFTGLWYGATEYGRRAEVSEDTTRRWETYEEINPFKMRMEMNDDEHSSESKSFLGETIPAQTMGDASISMALDILFEHPNTGPFICKQLIQRLTTSNPSQAYVERVTNAFETGFYQLPDGSVVEDRLGVDGSRGYLAPVWAAILFDEEALNPLVELDPTFGKIREPVIRLAHWARVAKVDRIEIDSDYMMRSMNSRLRQAPLESPSIFNFYRPGYVAPGSSTAAAGLVAPELQITGASSVIDYTNFMEALVYRDPETRNEYPRGPAGSDNGEDLRGFAGGYRTEIALADDPDALADHLDLVFTAGRMSNATWTRVRDVIASVPIDVGEGEDGDDVNEKLRDRVKVAMHIAVTSAEFLVQQ